MIVNKKSRCLGIRSNLKTSLWALWNCYKHFSYLLFHIFIYASILKIIGGLIILSNRLLKPDFKMKGFSRIAKKKQTEWDKGVHFVFLQTTWDRSGSTTRLLMMNRPALLFREIPPKINTTILCMCSTIYVCRCACFLFPCEDKCHVVDLVRLFNPQKVWSVWTSFNYKFILFLSMGCEPCYVMILQLNVVI